MWEFFLLFEGIVFGVRVGVLLGFRGEGDGFRRVFEDYGCLEIGGVVLRVYIWFY